MYISMRAQADIPHQHNNSHSKVSCLLRFVVIIIVKGMTNEKEGGARPPSNKKKLIEHIIPNENVLPMLYYICHMSDDLVSKIVSIYFQRPSLSLFPHSASARVGLEKNRLMFFLISNIYLLTSLYTTVLNVD